MNSSDYAMALAAADPSNCARLDLLPPRAARWRRIAAVLVVALMAHATPDPAMAGPLEDRAAEYRKAAEQGEAAAQNSLGVSYAKGQGVPQDDSLAVEWYRKAANQGHAAAQFHLGVHYDNGEGVPKNEILAAEWYRKAADQGYSDAQYNLGVSYSNGEGVPKDDRLAAHWYRKAADQGDADAQNNLGVLYQYGRGLPKDWSTAYMWFNLAAVAGEERAATNRDDLERSMTAAQIAEGQRLSREWKPARP